MRKKTAIACTALCFIVAAGAPSLETLAAEEVIENIEKGAGDLYDQVDHMVDNVDTESIKGQIRLALESLDAMGLSPTVIAREHFGIQLNPMSGVASGITGDIVDQAEKAVKEQSDGKLQTLFDQIFGGVSDFVTSIVGLVEGLMK
ncbi:MAG: hypothetical protein IJG52_01000 [Lachnospiraceae bacterium]|nr:hypothetical protein [Lachnospiraceae bacterium]